MTAKETLDQHVHSDLTDRWAEPVLKAVLIAMESFARQQVNQKKNIVVNTGIRG